jgi:hypothetical protein
MVDRILPTTVWPIGLLVACLLLEASLVRVGVDDLDEGYFIQQATRVLHGQVPYRDFETLYTPGLAYAQAALFALRGGSPSLVTMRALSLLARAVVVLLLFVLTKPHVRNPLWAAIPGLILLVGLDDAPQRWEPHPGWPSTLFAILAVWCLAHPPSRAWLLASGLAAAAAYAFKQNTGAFILAAVLVWCFVQSPRLIVIPILGFTALTLAWLIPLVSAGVPLPRLAVLVGAVNEAGLFSAPEPTLLIPLVALIGGLGCLRHDSSPYLRWYLVAATALFLTEFPRMDTLHLAWSTPLLLVVGAIAFERAPRPIAVLAAVAVAALLWPGLASRLAYVAEPRARLADVTAPSDTVFEIQAVLDDVHQRTRPGQPLFAYPTSPLLYVLADRPNPTRFDHLNPGAADPAQINQVIADLERAYVPVLVISDFWEAGWGPPGGNAPLESYLASHYTEVARHGPYRVLARL